jgi:hypothetical protein
LLSKSIEKRNYYRDLCLEFKRRPLYKIKSLITHTFGPQRAFIEDSSKDKAALTTRRAGKSQAAATMLYLRALEVPNSIAIYIALTRSSAKSIMWPLLTELNAKFNIEASMQESSLSVVLPNGSRIMLVGADVSNFIERLRGSKYSIAIIDEAGSFRSHLQNLIDDILKPALLDHNGPMVLLGTPGVVPAGVFYDCTTKDTGYSVHRWTLYDNPHLPGAREYVDQLMKKRQWTDANPTYQREYCGQWVVDQDALVYRFNREKNTFKALPANETWIRVLSIDVGWHDKTAFTVAAYSHTNRKVFIEYCFGASEMVPSDIAAKIKQITERFSPVCIVMDTGGLGKSIAEEFIRRHQIPVKAAAKTDKLTWISLMNGDFVDGNLTIKDSLTELQDQLLTLTKGEDGMEEPGLPNDLCDATLYAWRQCKHYLSELPIDVPREGTKAHGDMIAKKLIDYDIRAMEEEDTKSWWES